MPPFDEIDCPICGRTLHNHTGYEVWICISIIRSRQWWEQFFTQMDDAANLRASVMSDIEAL